MRDAINITAVPEARAMIARSLWSMRYFQINETTAMDRRKGSSVRRFHAVTSSTAPNGTRERNPKLRAARHGNIFLIAD